MSPVSTPEFRPRRIDDAIDRSGGFWQRPLLAQDKMTHLDRLQLRHKEVIRCGYCGESVKKQDWRAHQEYCWFGGGRNHTWFDGSYKHSGKLRIVDPQWARGDRGIRR